MSYVRTHTVKEFKNNVKCNVVRLDFIGLPPGLVPVIKMITKTFQIKNEYVHVIHVLYVYC